MSFHDALQFQDADTLSLRFAGGVGDAGGFDQGGNPTSLSLGPHPAEAPAAPVFAAQGLGLGVGRGPSDMEYLQSLPTTQKIGLMLQSFSAGIAGRPNPIDTVLVRKRQQDAEHRQELLATGNLLMKVIDERRKYGNNSMLTNAFMNIVKPLVGPAFAPLLDQLGDADDGPGYSKALALYHPEVQQQIFDACKNDPNRSACHLKQLSDKDRMNDLYRIADAKILSGMLPKFDKIGKLKDAGLLKEFQEEDGSIKLSRTRLLEINAKLSSLGVQPFDSFELDSLSRTANQEALVAKGFVPDSALKAGAERKAKAEAAPDQYRAVNFKIGGKVVSGRVDKQGNKEVQDGDEWVAAPQGATLASAETMKTPAGPKAAKGLTPSQVKTNKEIDDALAHMKRRGIEPGTPEGEKKLAELTAQELPNARGSMVANRKRVDETTAARVKADYTKAMKTKYGEGGAAAPAAAPKPAAPAPQGQAGRVALTDAQRKQLLDAINDRIKKGADPEKVKKWAMDKYGLEIKFAK